MLLSTLYPCCEQWSWEPLVSLIDLDEAEQLVNSVILTLFWHTMVLRDLTLPRTVLVMIVTSVRWETLPQNMKRKIDGTFPNWLKEIENISWINPLGF